MKEESKHRPTVGRVLHAYSKRWSGPRPAIVVNTFLSNENMCNVNVFLDGANDSSLLEEVRASTNGNTWCCVYVFDMLLPAERAELLEAHDVILEWPMRIRMVDEQ